MNRYIEAFRALELDDPRGYIHMHVLDKRSRDIALRCVIFGQRQSAVAKTYGLSDSRIHQILNKTLRNLIWLHTGVRQ